MARQTSPPSRSWNSNPPAALSGAGPHLQLVPSAALAVDAARARVAVETVGEQVSGALRRLPLGRARVGRRRVHFTRRVRTLSCAMSSPFCARAVAVTTIHQVSKLVHA